MPITGSPTVFLGGYGRFDASGNYILTDNDDEIIYRITPAGVVTTVFSDPNGQELSDPVGIFSDPQSGNLLLADDDEQAVYVLDRNATRISVGQIFPDEVTSPESVLSLPSALTISLFSLPNGTQSASYTPVHFTALGGSGNYTWSAGTPAPPANLVVSSDGILSGIPSSATSSPVSFTVMVTDNSTGHTATATFQISIISSSLTAPVIMTTSLPNGTEGVPYLTTLAATGGSGSYSWSASGLPLNLAVSGNMIMGTPAFGTVSPLTITITVTDTVGGLSMSQAFPLSIAFSAPTITTKVVPDGLLNVSYGPFQMAASGGSGSYMWAETGLPAGLSIDPSSGVISGIPNTLGPLTASITVTDKVTSQAAAAPFIVNISTFTLDFQNFSSVTGLTLNGNASQQTSAQDGPVLRLTASVSGQSSSVFNTNSVAFENDGNNAFSTFFQFRITNPGGFGPADGFIFALQPVSPTAGGLLSEGGGGKGYLGITPSLGVAFEAWSGSGFPNDVGAVENGDVTLLDPTPAGPPPDCGSPTGLPGCIANGDLWSAWIDYDGVNMHVRVADGSTARPASDLFTFPVNAATLLGTGTVFPGFTAATGAGFETHDIINWVYNNTYNPIAPQIITTSALPGGVAGQAYSAIKLTASGGSGSFTWHAASGLPSGLGLSPDGVLNGSPGAAGTSVVTITATDTVTQLAVSRDYTLAIASGGAAPVIMTTSLLNGTQGVAYSTPLAATGGSGSYSWSATGLPLNLSVSGNMITGTPISGTTSPLTITITVTDTVSLLTATVNLPLTIAFTAPAITTTSLLNGTQGVA